MRYALADETHDAQLRMLAAADPMPGWVRLQFTREPSFFQGVAPLGHTNQVVALLDGDTVAGMGCRSIRTVFIDGQPAPFGYISGLRSRPTVRQGTLLGRGYRFFRHLHGDGRVPGYLTTIMEDNRSAIDMLTSGRAGLPTYLPWGRCYTYAIPVRRSNRERGTRDCRVRICRGGDVDAAALMEFIAREGGRRQFFPVFRADDLGRPPFPGLHLDDFRVALRDDRIVAAGAVWDQSAFRQTVVAGYTPLLHRLRPLLNMASRLAGYPTLPAVGHTLPMAFLAFACAQAHDPTAFEALLNAVRSGRRDICGWNFIGMTLPENDPLNDVLQRVPHTRCSSRLYVVCWDDTREHCETLRNGRIPHVEIATL